jgi:hypothetical protein
MLLEEFRGRLAGPLICCYSKPEVKEEQSGGGDEAQSELENEEEHEQEHNEQQYFDD